MTQATMWIKLRYNLHRVREVIQMAGKLKISPYAMVGHLAAFWSWVDAEIEGGAIHGCTEKNTIDDVAALPGFATAMIEVGWLVLDHEKLFIPNWERFLGKAAKARALAAVRIANLRRRG